MLFNSYLFLFIFLPLVWVVFHALKPGKTRLLWLVLSSLYFYSFWRPEHTLLIVASIVFNFLAFKFLQTWKGPRKKWLLIFSVAANLSLIGYYKYFDFFLFNINALSGSEFKYLGLALPLGISFFTFQQISFLYETYQGKIKKVSFLRYSLFVSFFPQLIAGPIVKFEDVFHQFDRLKKDFELPLNGLVIFILGLTKKVIIADTCGALADHGHSLPAYNVVTGWLTSLAYSMQLYFDFSGYSDMAYGLALLFGITLPWNFNSPYKAVNIQDFWRRWHITLGRFLKEDIYIPLGGNKYRLGSTVKNLMITFLLGGIWHGAGWTFILWGVLHGMALSVHRIFRTYFPNLKVSPLIGWSLTFFFVNIAWVVFRAESLVKVKSVLIGMFGFNGFGGVGALSRVNYSSLMFFDTFLASFLSDSIFLTNAGQIGLVIVVAMIIAFFFKNSLELYSKKKNVSYYELILYSAFLAYSILHLTKADKFLYFDF